MSAHGQRWALIVPVKRLALAKTRVDVPAAIRADLALAMALDTARACLECPAVSSVIAVSDDERAGAALAALGVNVVGDHPDAGLNPALLHGADVATHLRSGAALAAVSSDLAALRPDDLAAVLATAAGHPSACVADASGVGTTLLAATVTGRFAPEFGSNSWQRHVNAGAFDLTEVAAPSLRRDVDTLDDLREACALGVGPETAAVLAQHPELLS